MTVNDARDLRIGEIVKVKRTEDFHEVYMLNEYISPLTRKRTIYVTCKTKNGRMMKFNHKELVRL